MKNPYRPLEKAIGYRFRKKHHLEAALTHRSFRYETSEIEMDNQRLEFLGDAALGLVAASYFYAHCPDLQEGELTRRRSRVASRDALARIARHIDLGSFLRLGHGEKKSGGHQRISNTADALEAVLGAAFLDGHLKAVEKIFSRLFVPHIDLLLADAGLDNPKGALQEFAQQEFQVSPRYRTISEDGPAHARRFAVEALMRDQVLGRGEGPSKREAEMNAARHALQHLRSALPEEARPPAPPM